jgi:ribonuclease P protein component
VQKEEKDYQRRPHICGLFFYSAISCGLDWFNKMKFSESLKKNKDFQLVYKNGKSFANKHLVMYLLENNTTSNRIGISVSKKVGNSIVRHHLTRLIRESYRLNEEKFETGLDIVIVARVSAKDRKFNEIESSLLHVGRIHKIVKR